MVRDILDLESVPAQSTSDISHNNYDFVFLQQEKLGDVPTYLLRMIPKRKEKDLLNGLVWVDTRTFRIQRIEGTPTKKPSWWIKTSLHHAAIHGPARSVAAYLYEGRGERSVWLGATS